MKFCISFMDWKIEDKFLVKEFEFSDYVGAISFVNKIVPVAEEMNHHPDILIYEYKKVKVMLYTHTEGAVTDKDYALAQKINRIGLS